MRYEEATLPALKSEEDSHEPRNVKWLLETGNGEGNGISPRASENTGLLTYFRHVTSRMNMRCFKPLNLGQSVTVIRNKCISFLKMIFAKSLHFFLTTGI